MSITKERDSRVFTTLFPINGLLDSFVWQMPDGCGSAGAKTYFNCSGINQSISQLDISRYIYDDEWEGSRPNDMVRFYAKYYDDVVCLEGLSLEIISEELDRGNYIQILWFDDLPESDGDKPDGHWLILSRVNLEEGWIEIFDPSNAERVYDSKGFVLTNLDKGLNYNFEKRSHYKIQTQEFLKRWHDVVDESGRVAWNLAIIINPYSVKATHIQ